MPKIDGRAITASATIGREERDADWDLCIIAPGLGGPDKCHARQGISAVLSATLVVGHDDICASVVWFRNVKIDDRASSCGIGAWEDWMRDRVGEVLNISDTIGDLKIVELIVESDIRTPGRPLNGVLTLAIGIKLDLGICSDFAREENSVESNKAHGLCFEAHYIEANMAGGRDE